MALSLVAKYHVLDRENADDIVKLTGLGKDEIEKMLRHAETFCFTYVFWSQFNYWWSVRFDQELVEQAGLETLMHVAMERAYNV